jgi:hypothetical protein
VRLPVESLISGWTALVAGAVAMHIQVTGPTAPTGGPSIDRIESFGVSIATLIVLGITSFLGARDRKRNQASNDKKLDGIGTQTNDQLTKLTDKLEEAKNEIANLRAAVAKDQMTLALSEIASLKAALATVLPEQERVRLFKLGQANDGRSEPVRPSRHPLDGRSPHRRASPGGVAGLHAAVPGLLD